MYALRTIDVWDTLVRRRGHPDLSKLMSARHLSLRYGGNLKQDFQCHWQIFRQRCSVEGEFAKSSHGGEYKLEKVLEVLLSRVLKEVPECEVGIIATGLADLEYSFEQSNTFPDAEIRDFCKAYPSEKTLFLSDFYMGADRLMSLLSYHNLTDLVSEGISSCDVGINKRSGRLFEYLYDRYQVVPNSHVHIGDNLLADVEVPRQLGSVGIHYQPPCEHERRQKRERRFDNRKDSIKEFSLQLKPQEESVIRKLPLQARAAFALGVSTAPLFVGFMLDVAESCISRDIRNLFFFTREGEFFLRVWNGIFESHTLAGIALPSVELLEVSRLSTFCPSLRSVSLSEMMRVWNLYSTQSMRAMLKTLAIDPSCLEEQITSYGLRMDERITYPWLENRVQQLFADSSFFNTIEKERDKKKDQILSYLDLKGWNANSNVGIVDIGWRGTIQDNLAYLSPDHVLSGFYLGLQGFLNEQPANVSKKAFVVDQNSHFGHPELMQNVSLIEMLCNSPSGSVVGYATKEAGRTHALRNLSVEENAVYYDYVQHFQDGAVFAAKRWGELISQEVVDSSELHELAVDRWRKLTISKQPELTAAYKSLKHNETFGLGEFVDIGPSVPKRGRFGSIAIDNLLKFLRRK